MLGVLGIIFVTVIISLYCKKKYLNCFPYTFLAKKCWKIKLGDSKSDQEYFSK